MHTATLEAGNWWAQSRGPRAGHWVETYQHSLGHRHRAQIVEAVQAIKPETLLEVGCHCGPNLVRLGQALPGLRMLGVDINAEAITGGRQWMTSLGLSDLVQLNAGRIPDVLTGLPTGSCDVVLSCYALAYIAPADLDAVLYEMGRIASRAVVLAEPTTLEGPVPDKRSLTGYSEWAHHYQKSTQWIGTWRNMTWTVTPVSPPVDRLNAVLVASRDGLQNMP